jgi:septal ring factor EnvC (AmiA/AmiB activator)
MHQRRFTMVGDDDDKEWGTEMALVHAAVTFGRETVPKIKQDLLDKRRRMRKRMDEMQKEEAKLRREAAELQKKATSLREEAAESGRIAEVMTNALKRRAQAEKKKQKQKAKAKKPKLEEWSDNDNEEEADERACCCVCMERPRSALVLPCHHLCMCAACARKVAAPDDAACPVCQVRIKRVERVYQA